MLVRHSCYLSLCLVSMVFLAACGDDAVGTARSSVVGRWELTKGFRNKKETETLSGVYFQFGADGKMQTNLPVGAETPTDYELKKNEIHQKSPQPVVYSIQSATDTSLVLAMEMRGMQFEMYLKKTPLPPPAESAPQDSLSQPSDSLSE